MRLSFENGKLERLGTKPAGSAAFRFPREIGLQRARLRADYRQDAAFLRSPYRPAGPSREKFARRAARARGSFVALSERFIRERALKCNAD
jgi:hypothetical protein